MPTLTAVIRFIVVLVCFLAQAGFNFILFASVSPWLAVLNLATLFGLWCAVAFHPPQHRTNTYEDAYGRP